MRISFILTIISLFIILNVSAFGIADWQHRTPGGSFMYDAGSGTELGLPKSHQSITPIRSWYFYKNHIVIVGGPGYMIVNETNGDLKQFSSEQEWNNYIEYTGLEPVLWTRWHSDNWRFYETIAVAMIFMVLPIVFIALLLILITAVMQWASNGMKFQPRQWLPSRFRIKKRTVLIWLGIISLLVFRAFLDAYPQSW
ncbi:hypothetical protein QNI19_24190 [Cytophagaceae bacterium DM2B3-1]|uniref:Uncharacterized protein n=1 Tax=Xanthocytophaga flava TaxID=3048013 RepID=A0ABT7CQP5_9BACT|nr:hypothetical protein [Xanthocytophaga flavus]MDJ1496058.1 hypothetical protein [Xanthocytophaga flavus]